MQVKSRTSNHNTYKAGSHVMQYGDVHMTAEPLELYLGFDPATEDATDPVLPESGRTNTLETRAPEVVVNQRDGDLHYLWHKVSCFNTFPVSVNTRSMFFSMFMSSHLRFSLREESIQWFYEHAGSTCWSICDLSCIMRTCVSVDSLSWLGFESRQEPDCLLCLKEDLEMDAVLESKGRVHTEGRGRDGFGEND